MAGFSRMVAAKIIEFHKIRQMFAGPAARSKAALAAFKDGIGITNFQDSFVRLISYSDDPQRKRMKIEKQPAILHIAAGGCMGVAQQQMSAGVLVGVGTHAPEHVQPARMVWIMVVHQSDLTEVDGLDASVNIAGREKKKTTCMFPAGSCPARTNRSPNDSQNVRRRKACRRSETCGWSQAGRTQPEHVREWKGDPRFGSRFQTRRPAGLDPDPRDEASPRKVAPFSKADKILLVPPKHQGPADKFGPGITKQADVIARVFSPAVAWLG